MLPNLSTDRRGFTIIELLIAVLVITILMSGLGLGLTKAFDIKWKNETANNLQKLVNAYKAHYLELREAAARYDQSVFFWNNKSITPMVVAPPDTNSAAAVGSSLRVYSTSRSLFYDAGCAPSSSSADYAEVNCVDGFGTPLKIEAVGQRPVSSKGGFGDLAVPYFNPSVAVEVRFTSAGPDRQFGTADDLTAAFSSADLDNYYLSTSDAKMRNILQSIKEFHSQRIYTETVQLTYENSLSSYDDVKVPWVWQLYSPPGGDPKAQCMIGNVAACRTTHTCACPYNASQWTNLRYSVWDATHVTSSQNAMVNIGLIPSVGINSMVRDDFGMVMVVDLISGLPGPPPAPSDNYSWNLNPPYVSVIRTSWGKTSSISLVN